MKPTVDDRFIRKWIVISSLVGVGWLGAPQANAAQILYVVSTVNADGTPGPAQDLEVMTRLQGKGHIVTAADDQDAALGDMFVGKDLILISSSVGSGNQPLNMLSLDPLKTGTIPVICYEPGLYDELGFQTTNAFGNAAGHTSLAMSSANQSHPLAAGKSGNVSMVAGGTATFSSSGLPVDVGADAIVIAANGTPGVDEGRLSIWAYDIDDHLVDNTTTVPSRRVAANIRSRTGGGTWSRRRAATECPESVAARIRDGLAASRSASPCRSRT